MTKNKHTKSWLHQFLLIITYVCFYLVQFTANFDIATNKTHLIFGEDNQGTASAVHIFTSVDEAGQKPNIRLNKRFEPQDFQLIEHGITCDIISHITVHETVTYISPFYSSPIAGRESLRGPPVVVAM